MEVDSLLYRHNAGGKLNMYFAVRYRLERQETKRRMPCHMVLEGKIKVKLYLYLQCKQTLEIHLKRLHNRYL